MKRYTGREKGLYSAGKLISEYYLSDFGVVGFGNSKTSRIAIDAFVEDDENHAKKIITTSDKTERYIKALFNRPENAENGFDTDNIIRVSSYDDIRFKLAEKNGYISRLGVDAETLRTLYDRMRMRNSDLQKLETNLSDSNFMKQLYEVDKRFGDIPEKIDELKDELRELQKALGDAKKYAKEHGFGIKQAKKIYTILKENPEYIFIAGADQIDSDRFMIKGGIKNINDTAFSGSIEREKDVAYHSNSFIAIADEGRMVNYLGYKGYPLPVEFTPGSERFVKEFLEDTLQTHALSKKLKKRASVSGTGAYFTENGMNVFDVPFDARKYGGAIVMIEHGIQQPGEIHSSGLFTMRRPDTVLSLSRDGKGKVKVNINDKRIR